MLLALVTDELTAAAEVAWLLVEVAALVDVALLALAVVVLVAAFLATVEPVLTPGISIF